MATPASTPRQHQQQRDKGSKDPSRLPVRDIHFIIKTMRALRQPNTIKDTTTTHAGLKGGDALMQPLSSSTFSSSGRRGGGGGGLSSPTISSSRKQTIAGKSSLRSTIPHTATGTAARTGSSSPPKSPFSTNKAHHRKEKSQEGGSRQPSPHDQSSGVTNSPNWRALLYKDLYQAEEEEKEAIRLKYEPLLLAQAKLKQQQDNNQRTRAGQRGGARSPLKGAQRSTQSSARNAAVGAMPSSSASLGGGGVSRGAGASGVGSAVTSRAQSPAALVAQGSSAFGTSLRTTRSLGGGSGGATSTAVGGGALLPTNTPNTAPLSSVPSGASTPRPMTMGSVRPAPPKGPNTARGPSSAGAARKY